MIIDSSKYKVGDSISLIFRNKELKVTLGSDNHWRDEDGNVYGFARKDYMTDTTTRMGVGIFSLPTSIKISDSSIAHDHSYSCPEWQQAHNRSEADELLEKQIDQLGEGNIWNNCGSMFKRLVKLFGNRYWENPNTRDK